MKNNTLLLVVSTILTFTILSSFIQKNTTQADVWEELNLFHQAIALTFHPAEEGDFEPIRNDSDELVEAAQNLLKSELPIYFEEKGNESLKEELQTIFKRLVEQSIDLHKLVETKEATNQLLLEKLNDLHTTYHRIEELDSQAKKE